MQQVNFVVCGLLVFGFALGLGRSLGPRPSGRAGSVTQAIFGLALITAGLFTTDPAMGYPPGAPPGSSLQTLHGLIHGLAGLLTFTSLPVTCLLLARRFAGDSQWRGWTLYSVATGVLVFVFFVAATVSSVLEERGVVPGTPTGLLQRVAIVLGWGWIALLALHLLRLPSR